MAEEHIVVVVVSNEATNVQWHQSQQHHTGVIILLLHIPRGAVQLKLNRVAHTLSFHDNFCS